MPTHSPPARQDVPSSTPAPKPLSCVNCRRKKIKCDRAFPCRQCIDYHLECVVPGRRSPWLTRRTRQESGPGSSGSHRGDQGRASIGTTGPAPPVQSLGLGGSFWETICAEVDGLEQSLSKAEATPEVTTVPSAGFLDAHVLGLSPGPPSLSPSRGAAQRIATSPATIKRLIPVFFANVDPVFKVLHRPTLSQMSMGDSGTSGLELHVLDKSCRALLFAVCFAAVSSLPLEACLEMFGEPKESMADGWRVETEVALAETDLLTAPNLTTLQALTLYTVSSVTCQV